jgi:hypothetical protein
MDTFGRNSVKQAVLPPSQNAFYDATTTTDISKGMQSKKGDTGTAKSCLRLA